MGHLQRIRTFPIPLPPGCWKTPPAQTLLHTKALLYPANTYNWIRWDIQQPLTSLSFYHWDNTSKPFIKRQLYIQKKEHVGKTLCKTTPVLSLNGDAPALHLNVILWSEHVSEARVAFASVTLLAAPAASNLPVWVPFQDTGELQINFFNSWSLQNGKNNRWDDLLWRNTYFYSQTDLILRECVSYGGHISRPLLVRTLTHSLHHVPEGLELTHMWQQSSKFLSTHRYEVLLGARNEVSCVVTNISFHFLLLGPFAQVQESWWRGSGERWWEFWLFNSPPGAKIWQCLF